MKKLFLITIIATALLVACRRDEVTEEGIEPTVDTIATSAPPATETTITTVAGGGAPPPPDAAPAPTAVIVDGEPIYREHCDGCHGKAGRESAAGVALASQQTQSKSIEELMRIIREGSGEISRVAHPKIALSDDELHKVAAYVKAMN